MTSDLPPGHAARSRAELAEAERRRLLAVAARTRRTRLAWIVGIWIVAVGPLLVAVWFLMGWIVGLLFLVAVGWATWDYYRRGGMVEAIESAQRAGQYLPGMFERDDDHRRPEDSIPIE